MEEEKCDDDDDDAKLQNAFSAVCRDYYYKVQNS